jgi:hypothetical protein
MEMSRDMGEGLVIQMTIFNANRMLKVIKDPDKLSWEWAPHHLDVAARWLPKKGFKILPKIFDRNYIPNAVGDEGDKLITSVRGCLLRPYEVGEEPRPIWSESVLELPEMREELKRIIEEEVLDMSFEEEVVKDMEKWHGSEVYYKADEESLYEDRWTLKRFGEVLTLLADCMDQVKRTDRLPLFFEFYIS